MASWETSPEVPSIYTGNLTYTGTGVPQVAVSASPLDFPIVTNTVTAGAGSILVTTVPAIPANGTYQLVNYAGTDPFADFYLAPSRVLSLADSASANTIALVVNTSQPLYPIWTGLGNESWDYSSVNNWNLSTGGTTNFELLDHPLFDDTPGSLGGTTGVTINNGNVNPLYVTFNNNNSAYTFSGSNGIIGAGSLDDERLRLGDDRHEQQLHRRHERQ